jgi:hypothetical protein
MAALVFTGCPQPTDSDDLVPEALKGTWVSIYLENYHVNNTDFSTLGYAGEIVNVISNGENAGYIIIKYTSNDTYSDAVGNYYAIRYHDLTASTVEFSGAYSATDVSDGAGGAKGKATREEAEAAYTATDEYFGSSSLCYKENSAVFQSPLIGTWSDGDPSFPTAFLITKQTVGYSYAWSAMLIGNIVNVRDLENGSGYITFKYIYAPLDNDLSGQYCVLYWKNLNVEAGTADISIASYNWKPGDEGKATQSEAEVEYTIDDEDEYYELLSCSRQ